MDDKYITREELAERDERLIKEMSKIFADKMSKIMTKQTYRLLKSLSFYEKMTEKHENNFQDSKKNIK